MDFVNVPDVSLINSRIEAAYSMRENVQSEWGKNYWLHVIKFLQRKYGKLH